MSTSIAHNETDLSEQDLSFEAAIDRLQELVAELESGHLTLEQTVGRFREASELASLCQRMIAEAELRITELAQTDDIDGAGSGLTQARLQDN